MWTRRTLTDAWYSWTPQCSRTFHSRADRRHDIRPRCVYFSLREAHQPAGNVASGVHSRMGAEKNYQHWRARQHAGRRQLKTVRDRLGWLIWRFGGFFFSLLVENVYFRLHKRFQFSLQVIARYPCVLSFFILRIMVLLPSSSSRAALHSRMLSQLMAADSEQ